MSQRNEKRWDSFNDGADIAFRFWVNCTAHLAPKSVKNGDEPALNPVSLPIA
jgi:hypothetical protein